MLDELYYFMFLFLSFLVNYPVLHNLPGSKYLPTSVFARRSRLLQVTFKIVGLLNRN